MKPEELRIGNYVNNGIEDIEINSIEYDDVEIKWNVSWDEFCASEYLEDCKPIPITDEWLLKLGFLIAFDNDDIEIYKKGNFVYVNQNQIGTGTDIESRILIDNDVNYIHQLQNLYYALTANELKKTVEKN